MSNKFAVFLARSCVVMRLVVVLCGSDKLWKIHDRVIITEDYLKLISLIYREHAVNISTHMPERLLARA